MLNRESVFCLFSLAAAVVFGGFCIARITQSEVREQRSVPTLPAGTKVADLMDEARYFQGATDAPYTLVEFGDYQCPPCARIHGALKQWLPTTNNQVRVTFRHFPLRMHPFAYDAALAAAAAGEQGKFWQMHDLLYTNNYNLASKDIAGYAASLGLDPSRFRKSLQTTAKQRVEADLSATRKLGINSTPTLILCQPNGKMQIVNMTDLKRRFPSN